MDIDGVGWGAYYDLPATVAYATFTFHGAAGWQRPNDGVVIVPSGDVDSHGAGPPLNVAFLDISGETTTPDLVQPPPHMAVDTPPPPDPHLPEVGSLAEVFDSATAACLRDANFDMFATDAASDTISARCIDLGVAAWNDAISSTTSTPPS